MQRPRCCVWQSREVTRTVPDVPATDYVPETRDRPWCMVTFDPDDAILRTLLYADIFDYPLTMAEIHHYLIETAATLETVRAACESSPWLKRRISVSHGYVTLRGRQAIAAIRDQRQQSSARLW